MTGGGELATVALRALASRRPDANADVGLGDVLRLCVDAELTLPAAEAETEEALDPAAADPVRLRVGIAGLTGAMGALPMPYTALASAEEDGALPRFLELVQQPPLMLLLRAHLQRRFWMDAALGGERPFTRVLYALAGVLDGATRSMTGLPPALFAHYCGLLLQHPPSATALAALLCDVLGVPVEVRQLRGTWADVQTEGPAGATGGGIGGANPAGLGRDAVLGDRVLLPAAGLDLEVGPLTLDRLGSLLPGTPGAQELVRLVRVVAGPQQGFAYRLHLDPSEAPAPRLSGEGEPPQRLGWTFWVADRRRDAFVAGPFRVPPLTAAIAG